MNRRDFHKLGLCGVSAIRALAEQLLTTRTISLKAPNAKSVKLFCPQASAEPLLMEPADDGEWRHVFQNLEENF